ISRRDITPARYAVSMASQSGFAMIISCCNFLLLKPIKKPPEDDLCDSNKKGRKNMRPLMTVS
ncbi:hypothetical protein, partial [Salmonella enterica]|uniref:hypothetical protein n=1 Tax=Salmonella enterica TaxID=28901 RepID=UPI001C37D91F